MFSMLVSMVVLMVVGRLVALKSLKLAKSLVAFKSNVLIVQWDVLGIHNNVGDIFYKQHDSFTLFH